jgi:hypothetical protein
MSPSDQVRGFSAELACNWTMSVWGCCYGGPDPTVLPDDLSFGHEGPWIHSLTLPTEGSHISIVPYCRPEDFHGLFLGWPVRDAQQRATP